VHTSAVLEAMHPGARHELQALAERGWARKTGADGWSITAEGKSEMDRRGGNGEEES
jgi:repressor of nif and glnA expression